jgi:hypothetical protein
MGRHISDIDHKLRETYIKSVSQLYSDGFAAVFDRIHSMLFGSITIGSTDWYAVKGSFIELADMFQQTTSGQ